MSPLTLELSSLEIEPLEIIAPAPEFEQERSLDALTTSLDEREIVMHFTEKRLSPCEVPKNAKCCCCCPCCGCIPF